MCDAVTGWSQFIPEVKTAFSIYIKLVCVGLNWFGLSSLTDQAWFHLAPQCSTWSVWLSKVWTWSVPVQSSDRREAWLLGSSVGQTVMTAAGWRWVEKRSGRRSREVNAGRQQAAVWWRGKVSSWTCHQSTSSRWWRCWPLPGTTCHRRVMLLTLNHPRWLVRMS